MLQDFLQYVNFSGMAEGLVGGDRAYPNLIFYFPILPQNFSTFGGSRYWSMIASPVPDMEGGREQSVWFRFQQLRCEGPDMGPPCTLHGAPQYYDTYWYSFSPITDRWIRPELMANASGFYSNMLQVKNYWDAELAREQMMEMQLPAQGATNGSWLVQQARFAIVRSMISRDDTWHPRYGVIPGYGITVCSAGLEPARPVGCAPPRLVRGPHAANTQLSPAACSSRMDSKTRSRQRRRARSSGVRSRTLRASSTIGCATTCATTAW